MAVLVPEKALPAHASAVPVVDVPAASVQAAGVQAGHLYELADQLRVIGLAQGLAAIGFTAADPFVGTRHVLEDRKASGLTGGMQFTFRNPARSTEPERALPGAKALVVGAWPYAVPSRAGAKRSGAAGVKAAPTVNEAVGEGLPAVGGAPAWGRVARYMSQDHYAHLRSALDQMASYLVEQGWKAKVLADDNALVDRAAAQRAGVGWYGKNCNILLPGLGSWFVLGSVVTDAPLPPDQPVASACGSCRRCLSACPTGALVAPGVLDAKRCLAWLLQAPGIFPLTFRVALGDRIYGCDDCQEVCPPNRQPVAPGPGGPSWAPLLAILAATDAQLMEKYGRWYIPKREPRYLRRNALIALGNVGEPDDEAVERAVRRYATDDDELLRAHAVWASFRLGRPDWAQLTDETSELVREEMRQGPNVEPRKPGGMSGVGPSTSPSA